jgi:hypothetical protein
VASITIKMKRSELRGGFLHWCNLMKSGGVKYGWGEKDEQFKKEICYLIDTHPELADGMNCPRRGPQMLRSILKIFEK